MYSSLTLKCCFDVHGLDTESHLQMKVELDSLISKWGKGGAITLADVEKEKDRFVCCEESGTSMASNIWTGTEACKRTVQKKKADKAPSQMNREELAKAVQDDALSTAYPGKRDFTKISFADFQIKSLLYFILFLNVAL